MTTMQVDCLTDATCSGRKIIKILESNPDKDPEKYADEDLQHMRKVKVLLIAFRPLVTDGGVGRFLLQTPSCARGKGQAGSEFAKCEILEELVG